MKTISQAKLARRLLWSGAWMLLSAVFFLAEVQGHVLWLQLVSGFGIAVNSTNFAWTVHDWRSPGLLLDRLERYVHSKHGR